MPIPARSPSKNAAMIASAVPRDDKRPPLRQLMVKLLLTENGLPEKAGTRTARKRAATQAPVGVPSNGGPDTVADCVPPLGPKSTTTRPVPVGPLALLQPAAAAAAAPSLALASPMLKDPASTAGAPAALGAGALVGSFEAGALAAVLVSAAAGFPVASGLGAAEAAAGALALALGVPVVVPAGAAEADGATATSTDEALAEGVSASVDCLPCIQA